ncbi:MAG: STAS domain-containing protein [Bacillota bacterium]
MSQFNVQQIREQTVVEFTCAALMDALELEQVAGQLYRLVDEEDRRHLVMDFQRVEYISSQAIGILINMHKKISALKGTLVLCGLGARLQELLRITKLDRVLTVKPTQREATRG